MKKLNWSKLEKHKNTILNKWKRGGLMNAVYYCEGLLNLERGEFLKYRPKIKEKIKQLK